MKFHRTIHDPLPGERTVALEPPAAPEVDAPWIRQNFVTGRTVSAPALQAEQQVRAGHLGLIGRDLRPGVIEGLEVQKGEDGKSLMVSPGMGICGSGEDVILPQPLVLQIGQLPVRISSRLRYTDYAAQQGAGRNWNVAEPPLEVVLRARKGRITRPGIEITGIPTDKVITDSVMTESKTTGATETAPTKEEAPSTTEVTSKTEATLKTEVTSVDALSTLSRTTDTLATTKLATELSSTLTSAATRLSSTLKTTLAAGETPPIVAISEPTTFSDTEPLDLGGLTSGFATREVLSAGTISSDITFAPSAIKIPAPAPVIAEPVFVAPAPIIAEVAFAPTAVKISAPAPATVEATLSPALSEAIKDISVVSAPAPTVASSEPIGVVSRDLGSTVIAGPAPAISESIGIISRDVGDAVVAAPVASSTIKIPLAPAPESISVVDIVGVDSGIRTVLETSDPFTPITKLPIEPFFPSKGGTQSPAPAVAAPVPVAPAPVAPAPAAPAPAAPAPAFTPGPAPSPVPAPTPISAGILAASISGQGTIKIPTPILIKTPVSLTKSSLSAHPLLLVLVAEPVEVEELANAGDPSRDPCERDPEAEPFEDWRRTDATRLVWIPLEAWMDEDQTAESTWPNPYLAGATSPATLRNRIAAAIFAREAQKGGLPPWARTTVALALVAVDNSGVVQWVDGPAVARRGGRRNGEEALVQGTGTPALWRARVDQLSQHLSELEVTDRFSLPSLLRFLPPVGILPRELVNFGARTSPLFRNGWGVSASPVPAEQLDAALGSVMSLAPFDFTQSGDELKLLVPVPSASWDPGLLRVAAVDPAFSKALDDAESRRDALLRSRAELGAKCRSLYAALGGALSVPAVRPSSTGDNLAELVEQDVLWYNASAMASFNLLDDKDAPLLPGYDLIGAVATTLLLDNSIAAPLTTILAAVEGQSPVEVVPLASDATPTTAGPNAMTMPGGWALPHMATLEEGSRSWLKNPVVYLCPGPADTEVIDRAVAAAAGKPLAILCTGLNATAKDELVWRNARFPTEALVVTVVNSPYAADLIGDLGVWMAAGAVSGQNEKVRLTGVSDLVAGPRRTLLSCPLYNITGHATLVSSLSAQIAALPASDSRLPGLQARLAILQNARGAVVAVPDRDRLVQRTRRAATIIQALRTVTQDDGRDEISLLVRAGAQEATYGTVPTGQGLGVDAVEQLEESLADKVTPGASVKRVVSGVETDVPARVVSNQEIGELATVGVAGLAALLDEKAKRADDAADFGFLQVQTATYRVREHVVGRDAAMRMAGSPLMADLSQLISADGSPEQLAKFFDELKKAASTDTTAPKTTAWKTRGIRFAMPKAIIDAKLGYFEADPAIYSNALATNQSVMVGSIMEAVTIAPAPASVGTAKTTLAESWMSAIGVRNYSGYTSGALSMLGGAGGALPFAGSAPAPAPASSPALSVAKRLAVSVKQGAPSMKELNTESISVAQLIHNHVKLQKERPVAWTLRGSRITDRVKVSAGVEMREVAFRLRASVLRTVYELDIFKDDLPFPGFLFFKNKAGTIVPLKDVTETTEGNYISESRAFPLVKAEAETLLREVEQGLHDLSTPDADPPALFSDAIRSLELTAAILRTLEGRIKEVREAADACRKVQVQIEQLIDAVEDRHKEVREALLEARHDVTVTTALIAEEQDRVRRVNARRQKILSEEVPFVAFHRSREVEAFDQVPVHDVEPAVSSTQISGLLSRPAPRAPEELQDAVELWHQAPAGWLDVLDRSLLQLQHLESLQAALLQLHHYASFVPLPQKERSNTHKGIQLMMKARQESLGQRRKVALAFDASTVRNLSWKQAQARARQAMTIGDLLGGRGLRAKIAKEAATELDHIHNVAAHLYKGFGEVPAAIRALWVQRLSAFDEPISLRHLSTLPRWDEVGDGGSGDLPDPLLPRELQAMVDWLYSRIDKKEPEAAELMSDLVRICLLLASHAPVGRILAGHVEEHTPIEYGRLLPIRLDPLHARVGMVALVLQNGRVKARAVVEDLGDGKVHARIQSNTVAGAALSAGDTVHMVEADAALMPGLDDDNHAAVVRMHSHTLTIGKE